jgi:hypothetical protein
MSRLILKPGYRFFIEGRCADCGHVRKLQLRFNPEPDDRHLWLCWQCYEDRDEMERNVVIMDGYADITEGYNNILGDPPEPVKTHEWRKVPAASMRSPPYWQCALCRARADYFDPKNPTNMTPLKPPDGPCP